MGIINSRFHGILDYAMGLILIGSPWLLGFSFGGAETWIMVIVGMMVLGLSAFTRYEYGLVKVVPLSAHLIIDILTGIFLAVSPWIFGFSDIIFWPHLVFGIMEIGVAVLTERSPSYGREGVRSR